MNGIGGIVLSAGGARRPETSPAYEMLVCGEDFRRILEVLILSEEQRVRSPYDPFLSMYLICAAWGTAVPSSDSYHWAAGDSKTCSAFPDPKRLTAERR